MTTPITTSAPSTRKRILFLDVLRAFAILMMLQGHFVDTVLAQAFRLPSSPVYSTWLFMRGLTAPVFFFVTGMVFVFLLLKDNRPLKTNERVRKGLRRGMLLIGIGYLLRLNFPALFTMKFHPSFLSVDVLHCIGLALLVLIGLFALAKTISLPLPVLFGITGSFLFLIEQQLKGVDFSYLPDILENYVSKANGSVFTPVPWIGYSLMGGVLGWHIHHQKDWYYTYWMPLAFFITGLWLHFSSTTILKNLYELTGWENFLATANFNYLFYHLGHVLIVVAIFNLMEVIFKRFPALLLKIGSETLAIYSVHYVLLYGTWLGIGLASFWKKSLGPFEAAFGALLFVSFFILLIAHIERVRYHLYEYLPSRVHYQYRRLRVLFLRYYWQPKMVPWSRRLFKTYSADR